MSSFTIYPAIDLRDGQVVRLMQGDPERETRYGSDPAGVARRWLAAGAEWLHVVNLDGAFGDRDARNRQALRAIQSAVAAAGTETKVQFGGGLRSLDDVAQALALGVTRVILGTVAVEAPDVVAAAVQRFGAQRIGVGIDARDERVRVRGWTEETALDPVALGQRLHQQGVRSIVYTNIARDGAGTGVDVAATQRLAEATGLDVIASGGVATLEDVRRVREAGLAGVIIGRALYEGQVDLEEALTC